MFNPYVGSVSQSLHKPSEKTGGGVGGILGKIGELDRDDLLMLLLIFLLVKEGEQDGLWPMVAAMLYLFS